jgi:hypothetical protein
VDRLIIVFFIIILSKKIEIGAVLSRHFLKRKCKPTNELSRNKKHNKERNRRCELTKQVVLSVNGNLEGSMESLISWFGKTTGVASTFVKVYVILYKLAETGTTTTTTTIIIIMSYIL